MPTLRLVVNVLYLLNHLYSWYHLSPLGRCLLHNGWLLRERPNVGLSRSLPDPESVCTDTRILLFGNVINAYLNNHNIILLNIDGCEYCICRYLFDCILTWVLTMSSVCLSVCHPGIQIHRRRSSRDLIVTSCLVFQSKSYLGLSFKYTRR